MASDREKAKRMAVRRDLGNRLTHQPKELPRGAEYLVAHACFRCRKSRKVRPNTNSVCPQCAQPIIFMGRSFKAPKKSDEEQWKKVEALRLAGFVFRSGYANNPLPEKLSEVDEFIRKNPDHPLRTDR